MKFFKHEQALVDPNAHVGEGTRIWAFTNVQAGAKIGANCNICDGCYIESGAVIGDNVTVKHHVAVFDGVTLEDNVFVGSNVAFINDRHPRSGSGDDWVLEKTSIKQGASIGSNSVVLCGLTIGAHAVVGAGCLVTKDVPAHAIVCSQPGTIQGYACSCGQRLNADLSCACGKTYTKNGQGLTVNV